MTRMRGMNLNGYNRSGLLKARELRDQYDLSVPLKHLYAFLANAYNSDAALRDMMVTTKTNRGYDVYYVRAECAEQFVQHAKLLKNAPADERAPRDMTAMISGTQIKDVLGIVIDTITAHPEYADKIIDFCNNIATPVSTRPVHKKTIMNKHDQKPRPEQQDPAWMTIPQFISEYDIQYSHEFIKQKMAVFADMLPHILEYKIRGRGRPAWRVHRDYAHHFAMAAKLIPLNPKGDKWLSAAELSEQQHIANSPDEISEKLTQYFFHNPIRGAMQFCSTVKDAPTLCINIDCLQEICDATGLKRGIGLSAPQAEPGWLTAAQLNDSNNIRETFATIDNAMHNLAKQNWNPNVLQFRTTINGKLCMHLHQSALDDFCRVAHLTQTKSPVEQNLLLERLKDAFLAPAYVFEHYDVTCSYPEFVQILSQLDYGTMSLNNPERYAPVVYVNKNCIYEICTKHNVWSNVKGANYLNAREIKQKYALKPSAEKINAVLEDVYINDKMSKHIVDCKAGDVLCVHVNHVMEFLNMVGLESVKTRAFRRGKDAVSALNQTTDIQRNVINKNTNHIITK